MTTLHERVEPEPELATIGDLVEIMVEDVHTANSANVLNAAKQIDETLERLIDQRIAKALRERNGVHIPVQ